MEDEIKRQIRSAMQSLNEKFKGKYTISFDEDSFKVTNIPEEIDKFEDAAPLHDVYRCNNSFCTCRFCRTWCPCMAWWREKNK